MKNFILFVIVVGWIGAGLGYLYLKNYATKADVFAWEKSYGLHLPLWMKELPHKTGSVQDMFAEWRAQFTGEVEEWKKTAKDDFNDWLSGVQYEAKEAARKKAHDWVDNQFNNGTGN